MKRINFAIQLNCYREQELLEDKYALESIGITNPIYYGLIPFTDEISGAEDFEKSDFVITLGSTKLIKIWQKGLLPKAGVIFYDEPSFDQINYSRWIPKEFMLNGDVIYTKLAQIKDMVMEAPKFIKPTRDLKAFAGMVVEAGRTPGEEIFSRPQDSSLSDEEMVLVAPLRNIEREYRNFIVDGKLIDSSIYKIGGRITYEVPSEEERVKLELFFECVKSHYEPADVYVVDFALLDTGEMVIIEYNCYNCAGMYAVNRSKVFQAIIDYVQNQKDEL